MDCPNCGVYNPEERDICWRCDQELPRPEKKEKRRRGAPWTGRRMWLIIAVILLIWILITWLVPLLFGGGLAPMP